MPPDYIGLGYSARTAVGEFEYTFDNLAAIVEELLFDRLNLMMRTGLVFFQTEFSADKSFYSFFPSQPQE